MNWRCKVWRPTYFINYLKWLFPNCVINHFTRCPLRFEWKILWYILTGSSFLIKFLPAEMWSDAPLDFSHCCVYSAGDQAAYASFDFGFNAPDVWMEGGLRTKQDRMINNHRKMLPESCVQTFLLTSTQSSGWAARCRSGRTSARCLCWTCSREPSPAFTAIWGTTCRGRHSWRAWTPPCPCGVASCPAAEVSGADISMNWHWVNGKLSSG